MINEIIDNIRTLTDESETEEDDPDEIGYKITRIF